MLHLWGRAGMIRAVRRFFDQRGYLEVETPIRIPAPAPEPHLIPQAAGSWFLQTSPELCMKRLLARGVPQLYQICKCFRRKERGSRHLPEFTMLEWYRAGADYRDLMSDCEELLGAVAGELSAGRVSSVAARALARLDLTPPWERISVAEAFRRHAGMAVEEALARDLFEELLVEKIEPHLGRSRPTFLHDYPAELGALARLSPDNPAISERFELYIAGLELANGFSELIDPVEQRRRFTVDRRKIRAAGRRPPPMPEKFLAELALMPPAAGIALGLDRLAMIMLGADRIDSVLAFTPEQL
ncbi:MAG TPA: EF-P lysine aminoacylase GenX [Desulfurivibrio alkaliphilus]|uniref:EF-P lysine aminoacylase GenX n=1 Tax=Desulfurivibrio alkaliphilus TaxID=427923 RepID=A0A7C2TJS5_9BACT|nr:EF-P lysine aminoacylase GenX [Desulfurivibrio alkaliphilus]